ncbi:MAG TPA: BON domain-containing protein [Myxococcota bacterium]|nr:BON domain-containing protein [Myxococcota bacterium]
MRNDGDIKRDVEDELRWTPKLDSTDIAVSVKSGVVTLTGFAKSYGDRYEAEQAAKRVAGVLGIADDIEVRLPATDQRPDPEIARDCVAAIQARLPLVAEQIKVIVKTGWVTLEGQTEWNFERDGAAAAVRRVKGVKGVSNLIVLKPRVAPAEIKKKIEEAFRRHAEIDASRVTVEANGGEIILRGTVRTWAESKAAEDAAWSAPGVFKVDNRLQIIP